MKDGENGFIYTRKENIVPCLQALLDNPEQCERMGRKAYSTVTEEYSAEVAAKRFIALANNILLGNHRELFISGLCSKKGDK